MSVENYQVRAYAAAALGDDRRMVLVIDTDRFLTAELGEAVHRKIQAGLDAERWKVKTVAEVCEDVRRILDLGTIGQDPSNLDFYRSRPFDHIPAFEALAPVQKVPPVIAHAPPARRGRWSRG